MTWTWGGRLGSGDVQEPSMVHGDFRFPAICKHKYVHVCMYIYIYVDMNIQIWSNMYIYIYTYVTCMHIDICLNIDMYI